MNFPDVLLSVEQCPGFFCLAEPGPRRVTRWKFTTWELWPMGASQSTQQTQQTQQTWTSFRICIFCGIGAPNTLLWVPRLFCVCYVGFTSFAQHRGHGTCSTFIECGRPKEQVWLVPRQKPALGYSPRAMNQTGNIRTQCRQYMTMQYILPCCV